MKKMTLILTTLALALSGCSENWPDEDPQPVQVVEEPQEEEAMNFFMEFNLATRSEQLEFCRLYDEVPAQVAFDVYEDSFGIDSKMTQEQFEVMIFVACDGL